MLRDKGFAVPRGDPPELYGAGKGLLSAVIAATLWADKRYWRDGVTPDGTVDTRTWRAISSKRVVSLRLRASLRGRSRRIAGRILRGGRSGVTLKIVDYRNGKNGAPHHPSRRWGTRSVQMLKGVLGHHTGGPASFFADARFHVFSSYLTSGGAPGLAYPLTVDLDGEIGVWANPADLTWHARGANTRWLGAVMRGNLDAGPPTLEQRIAMAELLKRLGDGTFKVGNETWPKLPTGTIHRLATPTSCPGKHGEPLYRQWFRRFDENPV